MTQQRGSRPKFILLLEDDEEVSSVLRFTLSDLGKVICAWRVKEAVDLLKLQPFDLLITDLELPDGTGLTALKEAQDIPVIIITGRATVDAAIVAVNSGAFRFLEKPFSVKELKAVAREALETDGADRVRRLFRFWRRKG